MTTPNNKSTKTSFVLVGLIVLFATGYVYGIAAPTCFALLLLVGGLLWIASAFFGETISYGRISLRAVFGLIGGIWVLCSCFAWTPAGHAQLVVHREYNMPKRGVPAWNQTIVRINSSGLHGKWPWQQFVSIPLREYQWAATINVAAPGGTRQVVVGGWIAITDPSKALLLARDGEVGQSLKARFVEVSQTMVTSLCDPSLPREREELLLNNGVSSVLVDQLGRCGATLRAVGVKVAQPPAEKKLARR